MNKIIRGLAIAAVAVLTGCCSCNCVCCTEKAPNISVFATFVRNMAKERNISLAEAADMLYDLGVRGFDIGSDDKDLPELAATKLKPINFYFFLRMFNEADCAADCKRCLDQAEKYGVPNEKIVKAMNAAGYDGWYTLENAVPGADTYTETVRQVAVLKSWLAEAGGNHR